MKELPPGIANLINSCQVITSVASVVKELIENSLDAHASRIDVKLENSGFDKLEVRDNGDGIEQTDVQYAARPHYTSKISNEDDLKVLETYGFRGEALGALCNVADLLIITKTKQEDISISYKFDHSGKVISSKPSSLGQGTSVIVENLFENVPVRRQFCSNAKKKKEEMKKVEDLIISFASIHPSVRFTVYHNQMQIWQKMSVCDLRSALLLTLGANMANVLEHKTIKNEKYKIVIDAFLPKAGLSVQQTSRTSSERCIIAVNNRPVRVKDIDKLLNMHYSHAYHIDNRWSRYPVCYVSIDVPPSTIDVNIEPDKSSILFHSPEIVLELLTSILVEMYGKIDEMKKSNISINQELHDSERTCQNSVNTETASNEEIISLHDKISISSKESSENIRKKEKNNDNNLVYNSLNINNSTNSNDTEMNEISAGNSKSPVNSPKDNFTCQFVKKVGTVEFSMEDTISSWLENDNELLDKIMEVEKNHALPENSKEEASDSIVLVNEVNSLSEPLNQLQEAIISKPSEWSRGAIRSENGQIIESVRLLSSSIEKQSDSILSQCTSSSTNNRKTSCALKSSSPSRKKKRIGETCGQITVYDMFNSQPVRRPLTPYALFCKVKKPKVISANPMAHTQTINNLLKEKWEKLPIEKKKHYEILSEEEKTRHKEQLYQANDPIEQRTNSNESKSPKAVVKQKQESVKNKEIVVTVNKSNRKEYAKFRPKEEIIKIRMEQLKQSLSKNSMTEKTEITSFSLVGQLDTSGVWIITHGEQVLAINHFRILEVIEYHRFLTQHYLPLTSLDSPIALSESILGNSETWNELLNLKSERDDVAGYSSVTDEKLVANGFHIRIFDNTAEIIRLTDILPFYGLSDLVEILQLIIQHGPETTLEQCRPQKVVQYFQGEAVRSTRTAPNSLTADRMKNILQNLEDLPENFKSCLHGKPFFHLLYDLDQIPLTQTQL